MCAHVCRTLARRPSRFWTLTHLSLSPRKASLAPMSKPHHHHWLDWEVICSPTQRTRCDSCPLAAVLPWKTASSLTWLCKPGIRRIILLPLGKKGGCKRDGLWRTPRVIFGTTGSDRQSCHRGYCSNSRYSQSPDGTGLLRSIGAPWPEAGPHRTRVLREPNPVLECSMVPGVLLQHSIL